VEKYCHPLREPGRNKVKTSSNMSLVWKYRMQFSNLTYYEESSLSTKTKSFKSPNFELAISITFFPNSSRRALESFRVIKALPHRIV
jgi:hypothetical protein